MHFQNNRLFHAFLAVVILAQPPLSIWARCCGLPDGAQRSPEERVARLNRLFDVLEEAAKEPPRESFDLEAAAIAIGSDPQDIFSWVRDKTFLVPYRGALRGSQGVLMDRQGNSLDRALLLGDLLRRAQFPVRLVRGSFTFLQAEEMLTGVRPCQETLTHSPEALETILLKHLPGSDSDAEKLRNRVKQSSDESVAHANRVKQQVTQQTADLAAAIGLSGEASADHAKSAFEAAREHWWVQYETGGTWVDLDPTLPDSKPGDRLVDVKETVEGKSDQQLEELLDPARHHQVMIKVVIEQWRDGKLNEQVVLNHQLVPSRAIGQMIQLQHVPENLSQKNSLTDQENRRQALQELIAKQEQWKPLLIVGDSAVIGATFNQSGDLVKEAPAAAPAISGLGGLEAALRSGVTNKLKTPGVLTAEWIEYQVHSPQRPERTIRRQVFDLIGPAKRADYQNRVTTDRAAILPKPAIDELDGLQRNLDLAGVTRIVPQVCEMSLAYLNHLTIRGLLQGRQVLLALTEGKLKALLASDESYQLPALPGGAFALAIARHQWRRTKNLYFDRPNLLAFHQSFQTSAEDTFSMNQGMDIINNELAVRPQDVAGARLAHLEQGVLDTVAEASLGRSAAPGENTAVLYELSNDQQILWQTVRSQDGLKALGLSPDVRARIAQDLRDGYIAVAPSRPVDLSGTEAVAWWRVDPRTGDTLGIGSKGWGQDVVEETQTITLFDTWLREASLGPFKLDQFTEVSAYMIMAALVMMCGTVEVLDWVSPTLVSYLRNEFELCVPD